MIALFLGSLARALSVEEMSNKVPINKIRFSKIITLTGHSANNSVKKHGDINLWVDSKAYNYIENIHQFWLLSLVDLVIGKTNYSSK